MKTATVLHLRATLGTVPAAADAVADQVNLMTLALDALPLRIIHEKIGSRYFRVLWPANLSEPQSYPMPAACPSNLNILRPQ